jgi:hypothetical protein
MAPNATATKPAKIPAGKQPPKNSVWIRYHPWIEGVMAHISAWSIHLLVIGGAVLWFTYLAYALGFAHSPKSLPMEAVRFDNSGGGGNKEGTGTEKGGEHAPLKEGTVADKENPGDKKRPLDSNDRPQLTDIEAKKVEQTFTEPDARYIKQDVGSMQTFANLDKDLHDKLRDGINPSKGNGGTGTKGGKGSGAGEGTGSGTEKGTQRMLNEREKRMLRWSMKFKTHNAADYLRQLKALGAVLAVQNGPNSFEVIDLTKPRPKPEAKDLSTIQKIWWIDDNPQSVQGLLAALGLPLRANRVIAFIPNEVEDELAKEELAYRHLDENDIFETTFAINVPGAGGRKYDLHVIEQKQK